MSAEKETSLMLMTADAPQRPWQFSLRSLMGLMFVSSILFTLINWWGYEGLQLFVLALAIILAGLGLFRRRFQYLASSGLCCLFLLVPEVVYMMLAGCVLYFLTGSVILLGEWLGKTIRSFGSRP